MCLSGTLNRHQWTPQITKEIIPMTLTRHGHSAFRIEAGAAQILIDPFLAGKPSWERGWRGYLAGKNSTQGVTDEGDCGDGSGCGNGRGEAGGAARAAGGDKRRRCSESCSGVHGGVALVAL